MPRSRGTDGRDCTYCTNGSVHEPVHGYPRPSPYSGHEK